MSKPNEFDILKGKTATGRIRSKRKGTYKPRGKPWPKRGKDSEMDARRDEIFSRNAEWSILGNEEQKRRRAMFNRTKYWQETCESYIKENPDAGIQILRAVDTLLCDPSTSQSVLKELLKIKMQILGMSAPSAAPEPATEEEKDASDTAAQLAILQGLGIDVSAVTVLEDGKLVKSGEEDNGK